MRTVILGAAESGVGAAILAQKEGHDVFVSDMGHIKDHYKEELTRRNIQWEEGHHTPELILFGQPGHQKALAFRKTRR